MTTWFVSRHSGAKQWAQQQGLQVDQQVSHLDTDAVTKDDLVIGTLPVNLVAEINIKGARYLHLVLPLTEKLRGKEISANIMTQQGAKLEEYQVQHIPHISIEEGNN